MITKLEANQQQERQQQMGSDVLCCKSVREAGAAGQTVSERFRCPADFLDFVVSDQLSAHSGYFRLGPSAICYGRSSSGALSSRPDSTLYDEIRNVTIHEGKLHVPFDPTEVIDNLLRERYASAPRAGDTFEHLLRRLYYSLRPFLNLSARKQIQRFHSRNWEKKRFPKWPVDTSVEDLCETLLLMAMEAKGMNRIPFVWFWPDGANACVTMTHDVETAAGRDHCEKLMRVDDSFAIKAAFGIVPEGRYEVTSRFLKSIRDRGFEVVIHDLNHDGRLFDNQKEFLRRAKIINRYGSDHGAKGFRAGVLYRNPEWYDALEFAFDMSLPNVAHLDPQHGGCCTVMPYFIGNVLEIPVTTVQDYMLFYMLNTRSTNLWKEQIDLILEKNGLASFIVHPDYVLKNENGPVYEELLGYLRELRDRKSLWFALPSEIDSWWRARSKMCVVKNGDSWRIEGDTTKRARLAYARNVDGKLVYELAG